MSSTCKKCRKGQVEDGENSSIAAIIILDRDINLKGALKPRQPKAGHLGRF